MQFFNTYEITAWEPATRVRNTTAVLSYANGHVVYSVQTTDSAGGVIELNTSYLALKHTILFYISETLCVKLAEAILNPTDYKS